MADDDRYYAQNGGPVPQDQAAQGPSVQTRIPATRPPQTTLNPGQPGPVASLAQSLAPNIANTVAGVGDAIVPRSQGGTFPAALGQTIRGALALPLAIGEDLNRPAQALAGPVSRFAAGVGNAAYTAATGDNNAFFGPNATASGPAPTSLTPLDTPAARPAAAAATPAARTDAQRGNAVPSITPPAVPTPTAPATGPVASLAQQATGQPAYSGGTITKRIISDPNNPKLAGKVTRYGDPATGARPMSELGAGSSLVTTPDGTTVRAADYAAAQQAAGASEDPVAKGMRQQQEMQQAAIATARAAADAAGGGRKTWTSVFNAALGAAGTNNAAGNQVQMAGDKAREKTAAEQLAAGKPKSEAENKQAVLALNAQMEYAAAIESNDPKRIAKAEARLRGLQGKYDKDPAPVRKLVVPGGQQLIDGQLVTVPSTVFDPDTNQYIPQPGAKTQGATKNIAQDPQAMAIRNDKTISREDKIKRLQALGYQ